MPTPIHAKHVVRFTTLIALIILGSIITLEICVRLLGLADPIDTQYSQFVSDPHLPYKPKPHSRVSGRSHTGEYDYDYQHNSVGFRDREHALEKDDRTLRILGLGDSYTYGAGADFKDTYLYILEQKLNARKNSSTNIEIIKAGMSQYFPQLQRLLLQHYGVEYTPDLVLVAFLPNDIIETHFGMNFASVDESGYLKTSTALNFGRIGQFLFFHSHVFRICAKKYIFHKLLQDYPKKWDNIYHPDGFHEKDWKKTEEEFKKIFNITQSINAQLVIVHIPQMGPWTEKHSYPATRLSKWCQKRDVSFIDILPRMKQASAKEKLYYEKDGHCRPAGYKVIAETLFDELTSRGLVP